MIKKFFKKGVDKYRKLIYNKQRRWWTTRRHPGVAQFGSALEWGSRGREFDSRHSDQKEFWFSIRWIEKQNSFLSCEVDLLIHCKQKAIGQRSMAFYCFRFR